MKTKKIRAWITVDKNNEPISGGEIGEEGFYFNEALAVSFRNFLQRKGVEVRIIPLRELPTKKQKRKL